MAQSMIEEIIVLQPALEKISKWNGLIKQMHVFDVCAHLFLSQPDSARRLRWRILKKSSLPALNWLRRLIMMVSNQLKHM
jgi:hypothetical protein